MKKKNKIEKTNVLEKLADILISHSKAIKNTILEVETLEEKINVIDDNMNLLQEINDLKIKINELSAFLEGEDFEDNEGMYG